MSLINSKSGLVAFFLMVASIFVSASGMFFSRNLHVPHWFSKYSGNRQMTLEEARTKLSGLNGLWNTTSS